MAGRVKAIKFELMSPQMIKKLAVVKLNTSEVYDADAYPIEGGVMDPRLGVIDPGMRCRTCGGKLGECTGHFGFIELARPVLHVLFLKQIKDMLSYTCHKCGALLIKKEKATKAKGKEEKEELGKKEEAEVGAAEEVAEAEVAAEEFEADEGEEGEVAGVPIGAAPETEEEKRPAPLKTCQKCGAKQERLRFEKPFGFYKGERALTPVEIREQLEKVSDKDAATLGLRGGRPEWLVLTLLLVPPVTARPSITLESGDRSEDDLTHKLVDIIRINQRLADNIEIGAPDFIIEDLWELLQYHVATFFNNEISGIPPARHRSGRPLKTLAQRLKTKEGRFRHNLTGKRVNFSARTVISPDPQISVNEIGVPEQIAKELTIPVKVTKQNIKELREYVANGPGKWPGANYLVRPDGMRKRILDENKELISKEVAEGYVIERHLMDGDVVLFNRQPSLHRMSVMAHYAKILPGKTFRLNLCVCTPYNADFDGDEMNLHVPQTAEARAEAEELMLVEKNIRSPRFGGPIIGGDQDHITGAYLLTKDDTRLTRAQAAQLLIAAGITDVELDKKEYTGKEIFSMTLPSDINLKFRSRVGRDAPEEDVLIENGKLVKGVIDSEGIAVFRSKLVDAIERQHGPAGARRFLDQVTRMITEFLMLRGFSISVSDLDIPPEVSREITKIQEQQFTKVKELLSDYKKGKIEPAPGRSVEETLEDLIMAELKRITDRAQEMLRKKMPDNDAVIMAKTGARGDIQNIALMAGIIGQESIRGKRIFRGYYERTLPHFKRNDLGPAPHGFVEESFKEGANPLGFFFEVMKGREGIMDSSLKTRVSGYMQRRLVNALQDMRVEKDGTVRDSQNVVIQFKAGEDGIDPAKSAWEMGLGLPKPKT